MTLLSLHHHHHATSDHDVTVRVSANDVNVNNCIAKESLVQQDQGHGFKDSSKQATTGMTKSKVGCVLRMQMHSSFRVELDCIMPKKVEAQYCWS